MAAAVSCACVSIIAIVRSGSRTVKFAGLEASGFRISGGLLTTLPAGGRGQTEDEDGICAVPCSAYVTANPATRVLQAIKKSRLSFLFFNTPAIAASFNAVRLMILVMLMFPFWSFN